MLRSSVRELRASSLPGSAHPGKQLAHSVGRCRFDSPRGAAASGRPVVERRRVQPGSRGTNHGITTPYTQRLRGHPLRYWLDTIDSHGNLSCAPVVCLGAHLGRRVLSPYCRTLVEVRASIDDQRLACDERRPITTEEDHRAHDVLRMLISGQCSSASRAVPQCFDLNGVG